MRKLFWLLVLALGVMACEGSIEKGPEGLKAEGKVTVPEGTVAAVVQAVQEGQRAEAPCPALGTFNMVGAHEMDTDADSHPQGKCRPRCMDVGPEGSQLHVLGGDPNAKLLASVWIAENIQVPEEFTTWRLDRLGAVDRWLEPFKHRADCLAGINDHVAIYVFSGYRGTGDQEGGGGGITSPFDGSAPQLRQYLNAKVMYSAGDRLLDAGHFDDYLPKPVEEITPAPPVAPVHQTPTETE